MAMKTVLYVLENLYKKRPPSRLGGHLIGQDLSP
jgi:hypothetical protein